MGKELFEQIEKKYKQDPSKYLELALVLAEQAVFRELMLQRLEELKPTSFEEAKNITIDFAEIIEEYLLVEAYSLASEYMNGEEN